MDYPVIITYSNKGYSEFALNLIRNLDTICLHHKLHFYCLDDEIYQILSSLKLKNLQMTLDRVFCNVSKEFENYGSPQYNQITHVKMQILRHALSAFQFIHFVDCDVVCLREPSAEHYAKYKEYDIVFQHDAGMYSRTHLHAPTLHHIWACTGNTTLRNTPGTHYVLDRIQEYQSRYPSKNDQECLYQFFLDQQIKDIRTFQPAKLFTYELEEYTNGFWLRNNIGGIERTYFFHANHCTGKEPKIELLQKAKAWYM